MPVSMTPTTTSSPVMPLAHGPAGSVSPKKSGLLSVVKYLISSGLTARTPGCLASFSASAGFSRAAKPLRAMV